MTAPELDVYDIACLAGGPNRVVDTALVALVRGGRLRVHSPGQLATADLSRRHPVEAAVLDAVGPTGHRSVDTICWRLVEDDRLLDIGRRLHKAGLLGRLSAAARSCTTTGARSHPPVPVTGSCANSATTPRSATPRRSAWLSAAGPR